MTTVAQQIPVGTDYFNLTTSTVQQSTGEQWHVMDTSTDKVMSINPNQQSTAPQVWRDPLNMGIYVRTGLSEGIAKLIAWARNN